MQLHIENVRSRYSNRTVTLIQYIQLKYSNRRVSAQTAKLLSNHSMKDWSHQVESSTTVKSPRRQFSQSQATSRQFSVKSNHNSVRVKSPRRQFSQSLVSHQTVQLESIDPVQLQPVKTKMQVTKRCDIYSKTDQLLKNVWPCLKWPV